MSGQTVYEILHETLKNEKKEKKIEENKESYINNVEIKYGEDNAQMFLFNIKSKSVEGLVHKTIIVIKDDAIIMRNCDCPGYKYHRKCWHIQTGLDWINKHNF